MPSVVVPKSRALRHAGAAVAVAVGLAPGIAACGSSKPKAQTAASLVTTSTPSGGVTSSATTATTAHVSKKATKAKAAGPVTGASTNKTKGKTSSSAASGTSSASPSTSKSSSKTTGSGSSSTGSGSSGNHPSGTHHKSHRSPNGAGSASSLRGGSTTTSSAATIPPLPQPVVSGQAGGMVATLHAENHNPTVNQLWDYSVEATDSAGHPLSGSVLTEFVYSGQVVGQESPPTHQLTNGRLDDAVTYPTESIAYPLTFQVVVTTAQGVVTLDWPVKSQL
jgi:hypothetical protein